MYRVLCWPNSPVVSRQRSCLAGWCRLNLQVRRNFHKELNMESKPYKFLFLCTGNSARSILGEYLLRRLGGSRFQVFSAGSFPTGKVNRFAIEVLKDVYNIDAS